MLQKAGRHMEDTLIASYTALLAGYCMMDDEVKYICTCICIQKDTFWSFITNGTFFNTNILVHLQHKWIRYIYID